MRTRIVVALSLALALVGAACVPRANAQDSPKEESQLKPTSTYEVVFSVNELDDGKKTNSRTYSLLMRAEDAAKFTPMMSVRIGSKVPYSSGAISGNITIQYQDVGMDIDCQLMPMGDRKVALKANWEYSAVATDPAVSTDTRHPVFRQVRSRVEADVPLDKPTVISTLDDVASTHHYVFEVKVTKISE